MYFLLMSELVKLMAYEIRFHFSSFLLAIILDPFFKLRH